MENKVKYVSWNNKSNETVTVKMASDTFIRGMVNNKNIRAFINMKYKKIRRTYLPSDRNKISYYDYYEKT